MIGTGITLYLRHRDKESKTLDYRIISDIPIVTSHNRPELLKITFGTREVSNPFITEVRFKNTGKQVIDAADFLEPVVISRLKAKLLDFNVVDESEKGLVEDISNVVDPPNPSVEVRPKTLNPGDWFTVQLFYDGGDDEDVSVSGRIRGQTRKPEIYRLPRRRDLGWYNVMLGAGAAVVGFVVAVLVFVGLQADFLLPVAVTVGFVAFIVGVIDMARTWWKWRRR